MKQIIRCEWANSHPLLTIYHDKEWGVPLHDDRQLFEMLCLEGAQAGLSWLTVLKKREAFRTAFDKFDPKKMATYDARKVKGLLANEDIIRNKLKIQAMIENAKAYLELKEEFGSFDAYLWNFVKGKPLPHSKNATFNAQSVALSKDLKKRGFRFVGKTTCFAFMQAVGMIDDHAPGCFCASRKAHR